MERNESPLQMTRYRTYVLVWAALLALPAITVVVSRLHITKYAILIAVGIATSKAGLVINYFMHLKYEPWILKLMLFVALLAFTFIVMLTFSDVLYR